MKLFNVQNDTACYLINDDGTLKPFMTRKDLTFDREELVIDSKIRGNLGVIGPLWETMSESGMNEMRIHAAFRLSKKQFAVFNRGGHILVVDERDVETV